MLHDWPGHYCVLSYTLAGVSGDTAVLGVIPIEGNTFEPGDLFAMAGRHHASGLYGSPPEHARAAWLACTGWSARTVAKPGSLDLPDAEWSLDMVQRVTLAKPLYGHDHVAAGRFTFQDASLMEKARGLLPLSP
ncbi:hypothetical protein ACFVIM_03950 [Streptomyces sp. NPDC057638]|uniref:hypothetical protein n=1 Tax=Streptomyces sp. NPDC057638 TaxID=3346190 RepID=UPI0036A142AB